MSCESNPKASAKPKPFKPNIAFLEKVERGEVSRHCSYSSEVGTRTRFYGGEKTAQRHANEGLVTMPIYPSVCRSDYAKLTAKGVQVLAASRGES